MTSTLVERIAELTSALVSIPSHESEQALQDALASLLDSCGFSCELQEVQPGRPNLVARRGDGGPFLCSHADTHPPHSHPDPWTCRRQGELLVGRGALDAKGQIAALLAALEAEPGAPALVAITCDEEGFGRGSEALRVPDGPWTDEGGIVLEPTDLRVCTVQSGHIDVAVEVSGTPTHAYGAEPGGSPISAVLAAADALETCRFLAVRHPLLPPAGTQIGLIQGGEHLWRRPARARVEITIGVVPGVDVTEAEAEVRGRLGDVARRWGARGTSFLFDVIDRSEPTEVPEDLPIVKRLASVLGSGASPHGMASWTDAGNLLVKHGIPCVVLGAGELGTAHSDFEWVRLGDLDRLAQAIRRLVSTLA